MKKRIVLGYKDSSSVEKGIILLIGYLFADFMNGLVYTLFNINSFILTNILGISSLYFMIFLILEIKGRNYKKESR